MTRPYPASNVKYVVVSTGWDSHCWDIWRPILDICVIFVERLSAVNHHYVLTAAFTPVRSQWSVMCVARLLTQVHTFVCIWGCTLVNVHTHVISVERHLHNVPPLLFTNAITQVTDHTTVTYVIKTLWQRHWWKLTRNAMILPSRWSFVFREMWRTVKLSCVICTLYFDMYDRMLFFIYTMLAVYLIKRFRSSKENFL